MASRNRSARDLAYESLRTKIMTMQLRPGEKVSEVELASSIGASRTPVREALGQLASEGFISIGRGGGYTVAALDIKDVQNLFEALLLVARSTARLLVANATYEDLSYLRKATERFDTVVGAMDAAQIAQRNYELHTLECRIGGNTYLSMLGERVYSHSQRLSYMSFSGAGDQLDELPEHYRKTCTDHWQFLDAIEQRNTIETDAIARRHVALFRSRVVRYIEADDLGGLDLDDPDPPNL
ncbi:GntR family transcriptional regulator [Brevibacterium aurantiacum]|nr:GntR family transcriptional regulator [Brevibacterium aurantiacum]